jgi:BlaI family transcriptional regulator, penicillinase repressor
MDPSFSDRELDVMEVLWDHGPSTVTQVREHLPDELAYTTVLTVLRVLEGKGYIGHTEAGRAHCYHPLVERQAARRSALRRLTDKLFDGSAALLLTHLVADRSLSKAEIRRMQNLLEGQLRKEEL